ncbi:MAG: DNA-binding protein [Anaerolineae bacterium]|nr:HEPN domain-containing protein [Anaerolineales bacterium]MCQ3980610.1 DNA-binding protein [Anaerolineae bacterium]
MKDKHDLVRGWLAKAASDLATADLILESTGPYDTACFHAQQAIEKMLKGFLAFYELPIPRTHDLEELQRLVLEAQSLPKFAGIDLAQVTDYAVAVRYDFEFWPDQGVAAAAVTLAEEVQYIILDALPPECHPR